MTRFAPALIVALGCCALIPGSSFAQKKVVGKFSVSVQTGSTSYQGKSALLIRSVTVRQKNIRRAKPRVRCDQRSCKRLASSGRIRKTVAKNSVTFRNVNWVIHSNHTITVALHKRGRIGRFQTLGMRSNGLVVRRTGCLKRGFIRRKCPKGTSEPSTGAAVACRAPAPRQMNTSPADPEAASLATGDLNQDGASDMSALYNYENSSQNRFNDSGMWVFSGAAAGPQAPVSAWRSGANAWNWAKTRTMILDADGDCRPNIAAFTDLGNSQSTLSSFSSETPSSLQPIRAWTSGAGHWDWNRSREVSGDFNGDGHGDFASFYNYDQGQTGLWLFAGNPAGAPTPVRAWLSNTGGWSWGRTKAVAGDFNGDGLDDVAAFYNYDSQQTRIWIFAGTPNGLRAPVSTWDSAVGNWNWDRTKAVAGDFNGDGFDDVAALYNYDAHAPSKSGINVFGGSSSWLTAWKRTWMSPDGGWEWSATKLTSGDFNGDGKEDVVGFQDLGSGTSEIRLFSGGPEGLPGTWTRTWMSTGWSWPRVR